MKRILLLTILSLPALAAGDTFGTDANQFTIDFVSITGGANEDPVAEPSNSIQYGAVPYDFRMGKFEISRAMIQAYNALGGGPVITLHDMSFYGGNGTDRPATGVSWNEAARFINWLNTSSGHSPAYKFTSLGADDNLALWTASDDGFDASNPFRNTKARYFLPSENEWYRAAYYDPQAQVFRDYPTGTDVPNAPAAVSSGTSPDTAVYNRTFPGSPADITLAGGLSKTGTMGQGGNVIEWCESAELAPNDATGENRVTRGGAWNSDASALRPSRLGVAPNVGVFSYGFRVASRSIAAPSLKLLNPRRLPASFIADIESNVGPVDVYRSTDLINWGEEPIASDVAPGTDVTLDTAPPQDKAFYLLTPAGSPPPGE